MLFDSLVKSDDEMLILPAEQSDSSELGIPQTTDDIVQEKGEEGRTRRRHKTENVKQQWSQERSMAVGLEQAQRLAYTQAGFRSGLKEDLFSSKYFECFIWAEFELFY